MKKPEMKENKKRGVSEAGSSTKLPPVHSKHAMAQNNFSMNAVPAQEEGLVSILHEYFMKNNFMETLESFQKDVCKPTKQIRSHEETKKELISMFDQGTRDAFMARFAQYVPIAMRTRDPQTMKIEFYIQLYFFVYSIHPALGKKKTVDSQAKQHFISYLQGRGASLSKSPQFLQYYALTNVQKPQEHPAFKFMFTKEWVTELRKRVAYFLEKLYPAGKTPALVVMYDRFIEGLEKQSQSALTEQDEELEIEIEEQIEEEEPLMNPQPVLLERSNAQAKAQMNTLPKEDNEELESLRSKVEQLNDEKDNLFHHLENEKSKCQHWQNTYQQFSEAAQSTLMESQTKWFQITQQIYTITDEILGVCRKLQAGGSLQDPDIVDKISQKLSKYEKFIKMNLEEMIAAENIDFSLFQRPGDDVSVDLNRIGRGNILIQLDFNKIAACLSQQQVKGGGEAANKTIWESKILLMQALRWRINRPKSIIAKREAVLSFTIFDVLGLTRENDNTLQTLIHSENEYLVLETMGFINALTRDYYGREYLACQKLYGPCIALLTDAKVSQQAKMQLLLSFQWCSTKKRAQQLMIKHDMIKIVVRKLLYERDSIQPHYLEYIVALLVNILLHKEGPKKAEQIKGDIMMALINLIECDNTSVRSYVHGSLYPLLSHRAFREKAKEFGLLDNISFLLENKQSEEHQHQLVYLQKKLQMDEDDRLDEEEEEEEDNDQDEFFNGEYKQEGDQLTELQISGIKGEELLMKEYLLLGPESLSQMNRIQDIVSETLKRKSIMMDNSFYDRDSVNTPLLSNKLRRNISNNNSVYSNKSSNRVLKSEMNSRSQINGNQGSSVALPTHSNRVVREKLDTVHQNNSEVSLKEQDEKLQVEPNFEETFRRNNEDKPVISGANDSTVPINDRPAMVHEATEEYRSAFLTRARLVRTPPRK